MRTEQDGRLDLLVNDIWGGDHLTDWAKPFWEHSLDDGLRILELAVRTHLITSWFAVPLMVARGRGLVIEITDGDRDDYRGNVYYDLAKVSANRLGLSQAADLRAHGVAAVALTPGFLRSEAMLERFGVTEDNWRDAVAVSPHFIASETPHYVGRAVAALAADPDVMHRSGQVLSTWGSTATTASPTWTGASPTGCLLRRARQGDPRQAARLIARCVTQLTARSRHSQVHARCHTAAPAGVFMSYAGTQEDDMTGTTRIPAAEITGFKGALIKRFAKKTLGQVPSSLGVYWHNQKVLMSMAGIGGKVKDWDACDEQLKSFAHMAVAAQVGCSWCLDFNYFEANNLHLDMDKAREIPRWRESAVFSPLERQVLEYAEAMTDTPPSVTDEMVARLRDQLGDAALVELSAVIAFANFTTRPNVALGIESDGFAAACGLKPLAQPATVGS